MTDRLTGIKKDDLTNCYMKSGIFPLLQMLMEEFDAQRKPFTILLMDLDHFKTFNDTHGHLIGDEILKYFSSSIRLDLYGLENYPFRFGGDEFVIVFPGRVPAEVLPLVHRLRENMKTRQCLIKGNQIKLSFSGGIASFPDDGQNIEEILENADRAMYYSKKNGRGRVTVYGKIKQEDNVRVTSLIAGSAVVGLLMLIGVSTYLFDDPLFGAWKGVTQSSAFKSAKDWLGSMGAKLSKPKPAKKALPPARSIAPKPLKKAGTVKSTPKKSSKAKSTRRSKSKKAVKVEAPPPPPPDTVYLKTGGVIIGYVVFEGQEEIKVELPVSGSGRGSMTLKRATIERIEKAPPPPPPAVVIEPTEDESESDGN